MYTSRSRWIVVFVVIGLLVIFTSIVFSIGTKAPTDSSGGPPKLAGTDIVSNTPASTLAAKTLTQSGTPDLPTPTSSHPTLTMTQTGQIPLTLPLLIVVELQPESPSPGGQFIWILNPSSDEINLGCWALHSNTTGLTLTIEPDLRVPAGAAALVISQEPWLGVTDQIQLLDPSRNVIDQTPELRDNAFDDQIWYRSSSGEWKFGRNQFNLKVVQGNMSTRLPAGC